MIAVGSGNSVMCYNKYMSDFIERNGLGGNFYNLLKIYRKYNPKAKELLIIEEKEKKHAQRCTEFMENIKNKEIELVNKERELKKREDKLQGDMQKMNLMNDCIKTKYKNLFDREEQIKMNESVYSCCLKLKESALQLDSLIAVADIDDDVRIQQKVNVVLATLNNITK